MKISRKSLKNLVNNEEKAYHDCECHMGALTIDSEFNGMVVSAFPLVPMTYTIITDRRKADKVSRGCQVSGLEKDKG
ncbi:MAG: hypothetical protein K2P25_10920 [Lachnospiraceae bacterium]|nr:hypothetical protein [Lachnospiraceae bacterium]